MKFFSMLGVIFLTSTVIASAAERPNIVFIFTDDHALEAISAYGTRFNKISPTPNIDRIAKEGMLFERSYCGNSICGPSRASILTGKHSHMNGFMDNNFSRFDGNQTTFPKILQKSGYETAVIGKWHLISNPTGFDYWEVLPDQGSYYNPDFIQMDGSKKRFEGYVTDLVVDKSLDWLKNRKDKSKPFVLMTQQKAPHRNWVPAERHMNLFDGIDIPEPESLFDDYKNRVDAVAKQKMSIAKDFHWSHDMLLPGRATDPRFVDNLNNNEYSRMNDTQKKAFDDAYGDENAAFLESLKNDMSDEELTRWKYQRYIKNYLRCIRGVDENIGRLLEYLDKSGLAKNTIVIYASDQGFYLGEHGWYDKRWMFEESLSMPFIIRWPGVVKPGVRTKTMIQNIDYAPTFLEVAGAPIPNDIQGKSLLPILKNEGEAPTDWRSAIYYEYSGEYTHSVAAHDGVRNDRYKLMHFPDTKKWMLFDLEKDPQEMKNIMAEKEYETVLKDMRGLYDSLRKQYQVTTSTFPDQRWDQKWWKDRWDEKNKDANTPEAKKARVVFLGDSITQAWENTGKPAWDKHFAPLGALNWGYSGDRTEHLIWRLQNGDIQRVNPEVAVILIGTNNTGHEQRPAAETVSGIRRTLDDLAWKWPSTKIILMSVFPRGATKEDPLRKLNSEINEQLKTLTDGKRVYLLDINNQFLDADGKLSKDVFPDLLHLSPAAYNTWAAAVSEKINELGVK
ncbi:MAG: sulfatase/phosphatase domain-containing protein [Akkermansiaceae bacterium]|jgi:arylsulfatase A-like enzyme/lysophospholipase L1-like esterase|nr:sulfatase-like hydrolase/transferase [Luteolibacter sp.]